MGVASRHGETCTAPGPRVRFRAFGNSGLDFGLLAWIEEPLLRGRLRDAINCEIYKAFAERGIEIPFPKRDVYIREMNAFLGAMFKGKADAELVLASVGEVIVEQIKQTVKRGLPPKLTDARKKEKRRHGGKSADTPLIFGGQLQGSWRYEIRPELRA